MVNYLCDDGLCRTAAEEMPRRFRPPLPPAAPAGNGDSSPLLYGWPPIWSARELRALRAR